MAPELNMGMKCIKYMLLTVDAMFILTAALIMSIGTAIYTIYSDFSFFIHDGFFSPVSLLIAIGVIMLFVSIFGCYGAIKESTCMINIFALLLALVFVLEIAAAIAAYSLQSGLFKLIENNLLDAQSNYNSTSDSTEAIDFLQSRLYCCGVNNASDWEDYSELGNETTHSGMVPRSCCLNQPFQQAGSTPCEASSAYTKGCMGRLVLLMQQSTILLGTGAMTVAFIQFLGIIFSIVLGKAIRQAKTDRERRRWEIREQIMNSYTQMEPHQGKKLDNPAPVIYVPSIGHSTS